MLNQAKFLQEIQKLTNVQPDMPIEEEFALKGSEQLFALALKANYEVLRAAGVMSYLRQGSEHHSEGLLEAVKTAREAYTGNLLRTVPSYEPYRARELCEAFESGVVRIIRADMIGSRPTFEVVIQQSAPVPRLA